MESVQLQLRVNTDVRCWGAIRARAKGRHGATAACYQSSKAVGRPEVGPVRLPELAQALRIQEAGLAERLRGLLWAGSGTGGVQILNQKCLHFHLKIKGSPPGVSCKPHLASSLGSE